MASCDFVMDPLPLCSTGLFFYWFRSKSSVGEGVSQWVIHSFRFSIFASNRGPKWIQVDPGEPKQAKVDPWGPK